MKGKFLLQHSSMGAEPNIYSNTSSLILNWLLLKGIEKQQFSIREVAKDLNVSVGLVQRVFKTLVFKGYLKTVGLRTAKKFTLKKPQLLLKSWLEKYSIVAKCKMWTYRSGLQNREKVLKALHSFQDQVALALHSAAEAYQCKNTNLQTLELYILNPNIRLQLEKKLLLEPQERGYEILLVEPYYKKMLEQSDQKIRKAPPLLTFLDLYHFPLRGREQAEFMAERIPLIKRIYKT